MAGGFDFSAPSDAGLDPDDSYQSPHLRAAEPLIPQATTHGSAPSLSPYVPHAAACGFDHNLAAVAPTKLHVAIEHLLQGAATHGAAPSLVVCGSPSRLAAAAPTHFHASLGDAYCPSSTSQQQKSADWKAARAYKESGVVFDAKIEGSNAGGLLIRFYSLTGFLPYPLLGPSHSCKDPQKSIQDIAKDLVGSSIVLKVTEANEEEKRLIFSEKDANWSKYSSQVKVGDVFDARVCSVEDYGAFVHLQFPDGLYHLTGLVHVSEVSWDLVQDVRDFLSEGEQLKVKVIQINREKCRLTLSIKQLEEDPLLETLDKVIPQVGQSESGSLGMDNSVNIEPIPALQGICKELLQEDGITELRLGRQGLEKRVVSQDLELWLSNIPAKDKQFTLLARAGRQVQEVYLTTTLDQEGIKKAVQRVLGRVP